MKLTKLEDSPEQSAGIVMAWYFIGRLDGRLIKPPLKQLLSDAMSVMTVSDYDSELLRCKQELDRRGAQVTQAAEATTEK